MELVTLRTVGRSLYFKIPAQFVHLHDLKDGDSFYVVPGKNGATFYIAKEEEITDLITEIASQANTANGTEQEAVIAAE